MISRVVIFVIACLAPLIARAQIIPQNDVTTIEQQTNGIMAPLGVPLGAWLFHPSLEVREAYDDNIYAAPDNEQSDFITTLTPAATLQSNWDLHAIRLFANADITRYADHDRENATDRAIGASARYDLDYETFISGFIRHQRAHEDRFSPNDANGDKPTRYDDSIALLGFTRALGMIKLYANAGVRKLDFDDVTANGTRIDNSVRNRTRKHADVKLAYEIYPHYAAFVRAVYDDRNYDNSAPDRSSNGYHLQIGTDIDITGKVKGAVYAGMINRDYGAGFKDVHTADFGGSLIWNMTGLTSLKGEIRRDVLETTANGVSSFIRTRGDLALEHAFADNMIGTASLGAYRDRFNGTTREDDVFIAGAGITYEPVRGAELALDYDFRDRDSNVNSAVFQNHRFTARMGYRF
ncbi:MAG: outer membrane beta-barrel protein [Bdellovibrionales bacterium]